MPKELINKDMFIAEAIEKYPEITPYLLDLGVHCVGCHISAFETLEQGLSVHGALSEKEVEKVIKEMNKIANSS